MGRKKELPKPELPRKHLRDIEVRKLPNGYTLEFEGMKKAGYLYFNERDLLKGFMIHIGLEQNDELSMENIDDFLETAIKWHENEKAIAEIEFLKSRVKIAEGKRNAMALRLIQERSRLVNLVKAIDRLAHEFRTIKDVSTRIELAIRSHKKTKLLTLHDLGVTSADITEEEEEDDER
jgi:hypothetical protein